MRLPVQYDTAEALEQYLGDPLYSQGGFSFKHAVELDEQEAFPQAACQLLGQWGFHQYYIPAAYGGKFTSYATMLALTRVVARLMHTLSVVLGARYSLREAHWEGIFQKMGRENALVSLFDGSTVVNLYAAATCVHMWFYNRRRLSEFFAKGEWLVLCLHRLGRTFQPMREPLPCVHVEALRRSL